MNIKFEIKGTRKYRQIYVRIYKGKQIDASCPIEAPILPEHWDNKRGWLKNSSGFKNYTKMAAKLSAIEKRVYETWQGDYFDGIPIDSDWLRALIHQVLNRPAGEIERNADASKMYFLDWALKWLEPYKPEKGIKKDKAAKTKARDYNKRKRVLSIFEMFQNTQPKRIRFRDMTVDLKKEFKSFLVNDLGFTGNSPKNLVMDFGYIYKRCDIQDLHRGWGIETNSVEGVEIVDSTYLTQGELDLIDGLNLSAPEDKELEIARDRFIIGCYTGLRVSDYNKGLKIGNFDLKKDVVIVTSQKTGTETEVPIHTSVHRILDRWKHSETKLPPKIVDHAINVGIREVCKRVEINTKLEGAVTKTKQPLLNGKTGKRKVKGVYPKHMLISSHTARRTFATVLHLLGADPDTIREAGGWSTIKMAMHYVKEANNASSGKIRKLWQKKTA